MSEAGSTTTTTRPDRLIDPSLLPANHGELPRWDVADLPAPPAFGMRNMFRVIGPGAIMAATSIGGGEWLVGPAAAVKYSSAIFLIATVAIVLQVFFNLEAVRYTLYTGEPIYGGIMRLKPGPRFWAGFYSVIGFFQLGWPALAGSAAATLLGAWMGRMPGAPDQAAQAWVTTGIILAVVLVLSFGGTIERMLEYFAWTMLAIVFLFLLVVNAAFVPLSHWGQTFVGFFSFSGLPRPIDWGLIGALAATAGSGGIGNLTVTNWIRDKGFGMGAKVGAIPSAVGGHEIQHSHVGTVFPATTDNLARWREWLRYVHVDQIWVWGLFCFLGMFLNVNLITAIVPHGTDLQGLAAGAYQAEYLSKIWSGFWFLTLFNGFWILFKTQLGNTDILVRTITDAVWMSSHRARAWQRGIRTIYYGMLILFSIWGMIVIRSASPFQLFKILANMAGIVLLIAGVQIFLVNRRFLPAAVRPPLWREAGLLACSAFYAFFAFFVIRDLIRSLLS
ncbi:MAG: Nramp family divalent metal transporter [Vicinamibacteraceae bacterium]